ncbi:HpcH/HpaI aldolase family protein [Chelatococcus asaccharovorans]|uniref:2-keto-3-deoxy-L-rhamnonate aldolase RhmA n=1 Tax=Chelatococcus asaccharovorans TaxID=28210 RepID=A0A2V3UGT4_9HYPH|nr:aldolase/citrate lyase family protein [Chelatococcus asaccharovorans]MBS7707243.1 aldolase [Chelatococcus asaccharovorans]PXW63425.1 2-keto-3-deoxy-L-rhamnonate aldolase RhmA [Chelatococcus asaccharovorans]
MTGIRPAAIEFRNRVMRKEHVLGTFIKTPSSHTTEIIGSVGYDFVIIDQEHAPFDRGTIDLACLGARASGIAALVRVAEPTAASILSVLDLGATGVLVPHVDCAEKARMIAAACRYRGGARGFSNTTRAGDFGGAAFADHIASQDAQTTCIAMIEDEAALGQLDEIAAVEGLDAFFIGRGDLTAALGVERMEEAVRQITAAARKAGMTTMVLVSSKADARAMRQLGATAFVVSNDQNFLKSAAAAALQDYGDPAAW